MRTNLACFNFKKYILKVLLLKLYITEKSSLTIKFYNFNKISKHKKAKFLSRTNNLTYD